MKKDCPICGSAKLSKIVHAVLQENMMVDDLVKVRCDECGCEAPESVWDGERAHENKATPASNGEYVAAKTSIIIRRGEEVFCDEVVEFAERDMISVMHHQPGLMPTVLYRAKVINGAWEKGDKKMQND